MKNLVWLRGIIVPQREAKVSVLSPTAQFGLNVFEGVRCYWNEQKGELYVFRLHDHLRRLAQSCRLIRLVLPYEASAIESYLREVLVANDFKADTAVRITVFADGEGTWSSCDPPSMFIAPTPKPRTNLSLIPSYKACVSSWGRIGDNSLPPRAKVGANYINGRYAHLQARHDGYDLPIFLGSDGKVAEGAGACLFLVRNGQLITPPVTSSLLESITRDTIIVLAAQVGICVVQRPVDRTELYVADEVFVCGSAAEVSPIVSVDGYMIGTGSPGSVTLALLKAYLSVTAGLCSDHSEWRTVIHRRV